ncbi:hypothetical protein SRHO_G00313600 [Serrasalmus rhombeus]
MAARREPCSQAPWVEECMEKRRIRTPALEAKSIGLTSPSQQLVGVSSGDSRDLCRASYEIIWTATLCQRRHLDGRQEWLLAELAML